MSPASWLGERWGVLGVQPVREQPGPTLAQPPTRINRAPLGSSDMLTGPIGREFPSLSKFLAGSEDDEYPEDRGLGVPLGVPAG